MKHIFICLVCTVMLFAYIGRNTLGEDDLTAAATGGNAVARVAMAATNQTAKKAPTGDNKPVVKQVGVLLAHADNLDTARFRNAFEKGFDATTKLNAVDTTGNIDTQRAMFDKMIDSGYNLIVIEMMSQSPAEYFVDKAGKAGIPMIVFGIKPSDALLTRYPGVYYIGFSGENLIDMMADEAAAFWNSNRSLLDFEEDEWDLTYSAITSTGFLKTGYKSLFEIAMKKRGVAAEMAVDSQVVALDYNLHKEVDQTIIKDSEIVFYDSSTEAQKVINYFYDPTEFKERPKQQMALSIIDDGAIKLVEEGEALFACGTDNRELGILASRLAQLLMAQQTPSFQNLEMEPTGERNFYLPYTVIRSSIEPDPVEKTEEQAEE